MLHTHAEDTIGILVHKFISRFIPETIGLNLYIYLNTCSGFFKSSVQQRSLEFAEEHLEICSV